MALARYPSQTASWQRLLSMQAAGRLHHALLFSGQRGIGKGHLARAFALHCLIENAAQGNAEQHERFFLQQSHPDALILSDAESGDIKIEAIRELPGFLMKTPSLSRVKVVVLDSLDALNRSAANALLKMLEEPPPGVLFFLVVHRLGALLATLRSRCFLLPIPAPDRAAFAAVLPDADYDRYGGSIGLARHWQASDEHELLDKTIDYMQASTPPIPPQILEVAKALAGASPALFAAFIEQLAAAVHTRIKKMALNAVPLPEAALTALLERIQFYRRDALKLHYDRQQVVVDAFLHLRALQTARITGA
ncbi:MAG: hypothetical protein ACK5XX_02780 [Holosporales bacterium]